MAMHGFIHLRGIECCDGIEREAIDAACFGILGEVVHVARNDQ
jgi:hypothetical protein